MWEAAVAATMAVYQSEYNRAMMNANVHLTPEQIAAQYRNQGSNLAGKDTMIRHKIDNKLPIMGIDARSSLFEPGELEQLGYRINVATDSWVHPSNTLDNWNANQQPTIQPVDLRALQRREQAHQHYAQNRTAYLDLHKREHADATPDPSGGFIKEAPPVVHNHYHTQSVPEIVVKTKGFPWEAVSAVLALIAMFSGQLTTLFHWLF